MPGDWLLAAAKAVGLVVGGSVAVMSVIFFFMEVAEGRLWALWTLIVLTCGAWLVVIGELAVTLHG